MIQYSRQLQNSCQNEQFQAQLYLFPLTNLKSFGIFAIFILSLLSCLAGIGGGALYVPLSMIFYQMKITDSAALSVILVTGNMTLRYIIYIKKKMKRKNSHKPVIDYDVSIIFSPSIFIGTLFGVLFNHMFPPWLLLAMYMIFMYFTFTNCYQKWQQNREQEKRQQIQKDIQMQKLITIQKDSTLVQPQPLNINEQNNGKQEIISITNSSFKDDSQKPILTNNNQNIQEEIIKYESQLVQWKHIYFILAGIISMLILNLLRGSRNFESIINIKLCGRTYWLLFFSYIPIALLILYFTQQYLLKNHKEKVKCGHQFETNDIQYNQQTIIKMSIYGLIIGTISAMLGIGGGIIIAPFLLILKMEPTVSSYTTSFMTLFTSFINAIQFFIRGIKTWDFIIVSFIASMMGFGIGIVILLRIQKINKQSYIVLCLLVLIILSTLFFFLSGMRQIVNSIYCHAFQIGINYPC